MRYEINRIEFEKAIEIKDVINSLKEYLGKDFKVGRIELDNDHEYSVNSFGEIEINISKDFIREDVNEYDPNELEISEEEFNYNLINKPRKFTILYLSSKKNDPEELKITERLNQYFYNTLLNTNNV